MNKIFLDTDVVINLLKKKSETLEKLNFFSDAQFFISPIVVAEIYAGARQKELAEIEEFFLYLTILDITDSIGKIAGNYANFYKKAYNKISLEDYLIAATVKEYKLKLWTYNKKHYPMQDIELV